MIPHAHRKELCLRKRQAGCAPLTTWTFSLENVRAIRSILVSALGFVAAEHIDILEVVVPWSCCGTNNFLTISVHETLLGSPHPPPGQTLEVEARLYASRRAASRQSLSERSVIGPLSRISVIRNRPYGDMKSTVRVGVMVVNLDAHSDSRDFAEARHDVICNSDCF
jgi:hypothetical protein